MRCYFDDSPEARPVEARIQAARFFHDISLDGSSEPCLSKHPCGPDVYRGELVFVSPEEFALVWDVSGPRKLGHIRATFTRRGISS